MYVVGVSEIQFKCKLVDSGHLKTIDDLLIHLDKNSHFLMIWPNQNVDTPFIQMQWNRICT